ncbi:hypothetical protein Xen7305DRAFT_00043090, partial [Xenococcus sp. PCC 7305]
MEVKALSFTVLLGYIETVIETL